METNKNFIELIKVATFLCFVAGLSGCALPIKRTVASTPPHDAPLSQFILGEWQSMDVVSNESNAYDIKYQIIFESEYRVKLIVIYPDQNTEGYSFSYDFIDQDTIHVNNLRTTGGENWHLEKRNGNLIVTRYLNGSAIRIVLVRLE